MAHPEDVTCHHSYSRLTFSYISKIDHYHALVIICVYIRFITKNIGRQTATRIHEQKA